MDPEVKMELDHHLSEIQSIADSCLGKAREKFGNIPEVVCEFGDTAETVLAITEEGKIIFSYHVALMMECLETFRHTLIRELVPHEVAHHITLCIFQRETAHGENFCLIAKYLGVPTARYEAWNRIKGLEK